MNTFTELEAFQAIRVMAKRGTVEIWQKKVCRYSDGVHYIFKTGRTLNSSIYQVYQLFCKAYPNAI